MEEYVKISLERFQELQKFERECKDIREQGIPMYINIGYYKYARVVFPKDYESELKNKIEELGIELGAKNRVIDRLRNRNWYQRLFNL